MVEEGEKVSKATGKRKMTFNDEDDDSDETEFDDDVNQYIVAPNEQSYGATKSSSQTYNSLRKTPSKDDTHLVKEPTVSTVVNILKLVETTSTTPIVDSGLPGSRGNLENQVKLE